MKKATLGTRLTSLILTGAMLLPALTGLPVRAATPELRGEMTENTKVSLNFPAAKWDPTTSTTRLRLDVADNTAVVDEFTYEITSANKELYEIDQYGYVKLKADKTPTDDPIEVRATVKYYDGTDVTFADNVVDTTTKTFTGASATYGISGTSAVNQQVARTGQYGITTDKGSWNTAPLKTISESTDVTVTAWYYDPYTADEVAYTETTLPTGETSQYKAAEGQLGIYLNGTIVSDPATYFMGIAYIAAGTTPPYQKGDYYLRGGADGKVYVKSSEKRSEGWHKLVWTVTGSGSTMTMSKLGEDGTLTQVGTTEATGARKVSSISIANNKGAAKYSAIYMENKHFLDDISVVKTSATPKSGTITLSIPVDYVAPGEVTIQTQPAAQTAMVGETAQFTVAATSTTGTLTYQWFTCDAAGENGTVVAESNTTAKTATLALTAVAKTQSDTYYYCNVSGGGTAVKSAVVKLTVLEETDRPAQPTGLTIQEDGSITFAYGGSAETKFELKIYADDGSTALTTVTKTVTLNNSNWVNLNLLAELRALGVGRYVFTARYLGGAGGVDSLESARSAAIALKKLPAPSGVIWQGATLKWQPVEGAKSYILQLYKDGTVSGSAVTVAGDVTQHIFSLPRTMPNGISATVVAVANPVGTLFFDSDPAASASMNEELRLSFDPVSLAKGNKERVFIEGPDRMGIDEFSFTSSSPDVTVDKYGYVTVADDLVVPVTGLEVTITANVKYYADTVWANNMEAYGKFANNELNTVNGGGARLHLTGESELPDGEAARTGRMGATPYVQNGFGSNVEITPTVGSLNFWYYDPYTPEEKSYTGTDAAKYGVSINVFGPSDPPAVNFAGVAYNDGPADNYAKPDKYSYRVSGTNWVNLPVARSTGWHKFEFRVTSAGMELYVDGNKVRDLDASITSITGLQLCNNWGTQAGNGTFINGKHFIDDIYIVAAGATTTTATLTKTIKVTPKEYAITTDTVEYDLNYPEKDICLTVTPDLTDFASATLGGAALVKDTDYTVAGNVITLTKELLGKQAAGTPELVLTMTDATKLKCSLNLTKPAPRSYYVSNGGADANDGLTAQTAWKTLSKLNAATFHYGDSIFLDATSVFNEQLVLKGDGREGNPITLTRYNQDQTHLRPVINGGGTDGTKSSYIVEGNSSGATKLNGAVELWNSGYWEISWLEVTNLGATTGNGRSGIMVMNDYAPTQAARTAANWWASRKDHVYITDCYVHDVNGKHQAQGGTKHAGGIIGYGYLSDFKVERCRVSRVDNEGIRNTIFHPGGTNNSAGYPATAATYITFKNNFIDKVSGDAMVVAGANHSEMSYNVATTLGLSYVTDKSGNNLEANAAPVFLGDQNYAAMWVMGCKNSVAQFNEVYNTQYDCPDGEAWDIDLYSENYVYQYNYSHGNSGGCVLFMSESKNNVFRYNLSINDGGRTTVATGNRNHLIYYAASGSGASNAFPQIYNNVFGLSATLNSLVDGNTAASEYLHMQNNIFYAFEGNTNKPRLMFKEGDKPTGEFSNNIFWPADLYGTQITDQLATDAVTTGNVGADPKLVDTSKVPAISGDWSGEWATNSALTSLNWFEENVGKLNGYKLQADSPAINAGVSVPYWPEIPEENRFPLIRDFFGNELDGTEVPDIGIQEYSNDVPAGSFMVTFDKNGGDTAATPAKVIVVSGNKVTPLPTPPTRMGYDFAGWNTAADGTGSPFTADTAVTAALKAFAVWTPQSYHYTVTFDKNGGTGEATPAAKSVDGPAIRIDALPTAPTWKGYRVASWNTAADGTGTEFTADTLVVGNITVYAQWAEYIEVFTVTFDKNGGDTEASPASKTITVPASTLGSLPTAPMRNGHSFTGWNTAADGTGTPFLKTTKVTGSITVYAQWKQTGTYMVTYNKNGGDTAATPAEQVVVPPATTVVTLPTPPARSGYDFAGWNRAADGTGTAFTGASTVSDDFTVYAQWTETVTGGIDGGGGSRPTTKPKPPAVVVTKTEGGAVESKTNRDGSVTYAFKPEEGKEVRYIRVNGISVLVTDQVTVPAGKTASIVAVFAGADEEPAQRFADLATQSEETMAAITYSVGSGLFAGTDETTFAPTMGMNRAMFATVLARLYGAVLTDAPKAEFDDVKADSWYSAPIAWAASMGIVSGVGSNNFAPERDMTREELTVLVYRFAQKAGVNTATTGDLSAFADAGAVNTWGTEAMTWAASIGLIQGREGNLAPGATITRAEAAIVLARMSTLLVVQ